MPNELKTGRLKEHDPESWQYRDVRAAIAPKSVTHNIDARALNQNGYNACTGFSAAQLLNCSKAFINRRRFWNNYAMKWGNNAPYLLDMDGITLYRMATRRFVNQNARRDSQQYFSVISLFERGRHVPD